MSLIYDIDLHQVGRDPGFQGTFAALVRALVEDVSVEGDHYGPCEITTADGEVYHGNLLPNHGGGCIWLHDTEFGVVQIEDSTIERIRI